MLSSVVNRVLRTGFVSAIPVMVFLSQSAQAAEAQNRTVIPFAFRVGNHELPAGSYQIDKAFQSRVYYLRSVSTGKAAMINFPAGFGTNPAQLVFSQDQKGYVLQQVR